MAVAGWSPPADCDLWLYSAADVAASGSWLDQSGNGRHHTLFGGASVTAGAGLALDGSGDYAEGPVSWIGGYTAITTMGWVNMDSTITQANPKLMGDDNTDPFSMYMPSFGQGLGATINNSINSGLGTGTYDTWVHLAITWDRTTIRGFVNGVLSGTASYGGGTATINSTAQKWRIGDAPDAARELKGSVDDLMVFSRALNVSEIGDIIANSPGKH